MCPIELPTNIPKPAETGIKKNPKSGITVSLFSSLMPDDSAAVIPMPNRSPISPPIAPPVVLPSFVFSSILS